MFLKAYVTGTGATQERLTAINRQVQKVNEELSRLRLMIDSLPPLELDLREDKMLSAATDNIESFGNIEAKRTYSSQDD